LALEQRVAMKFMLPHVADREGNLERFMREARAASKLRSEHVPKVLDFGTLENNMPYLVMELLEGRDLADMIVPTNPMDVAELCEIGIQACEALSEAHGRGIIHRDIKPANIFVTRRADGSPCVKVLDFGIAKQLSELGALDGQGLTATDAMIGSPYYMSPEQLRSARDVDARSDIWSLGVALYQALTGKRPYIAPNLGALILCIVEMVPQAPNVLRPNVPPELATAVMRCLQRNPNDRFQTMAELAFALAPFAHPRCHALLNRIQANCLGTGDRSSLLVPAPDGQGGRISVAPTPSPNNGGGGRPSFQPAAQPSPFSATNEPWTGTHSNRRSQGIGRWAAIAAAALVGAIVMAVLLRGGSNVAPDSPPPPAAATPPTTPISNTVHATPTATPAPATTGSTIAAASSSASKAPKSAPAAGKPAAKSNTTTKLPDYGGRK
jgi:serine/threonine protein kinase